jgi:hypothetical protein
MNFNFNNYSISSYAIAGIAIIAIGWYSGGYKWIQTDANSAYTRRVLVIDLNKHLGQTLELDSLFNQYKAKFGNKLCFLDPNTKNLKVADNKEQIDKGVFFNDILLIRVVDKMKNIDMLDDVKRRIFVRFQKNNSLLMANVDLYKSENKKPQKKYSSSRQEVDLQNPTDFLAKEIETVLKLGVRDSRFR